MSGAQSQLEYSSLEYKPQAPEIKYFLTQFVHDYYSRNRATVRDDFSRSLMFLDSRIAAERMEQNRKTKEIEQFMIGAKRKSRSEFKTSFSRISGSLRFVPRSIF